MTEVTQAKPPPPSENFHRARPKMYLVTRILEKGQMLTKMVGSQYHSVLLAYLASFNKNRHWVRL